MKISKADIDVIPFITSTMNVFIFTYNSENNIFGDIWKQFNWVIKGYISAKLYENNLCCMSGTSKF